MDDKPIKFSDFQQKLIPILNEKMNEIGIRDPQGFSIAGATTHFVQDEIGDNVNINIGGVNIPVVMVVGNSTYVVYYFALKPLMQEVADREKEKKEKDG